MEFANFPESFLDRSAVCLLVDYSDIPHPDTLGLTLENFLEETVRPFAFYLVCVGFTSRWASVPIEIHCEDDLSFIRRKVGTLVDMIRVCSTLRHKAFRVSAASHPVPSQSAWMFHCTLCLLYAYGFLGEDTAVDVGGTRLTIAIQQTQYLLDQALASYSFERDLQGDARVEYASFDSIRSIERFFNNRPVPSLIPRVVVTPSSDRAALPTMSWSSTQRVAEAVLLAAIRYGAPIQVETVDNDHAIGVSRECIDQIVAEMVSPPFFDGTGVDRETGCCGTLGEQPVDGQYSRLDRASRDTSREAWSPLSERVTPDRDNRPPDDIMLSACIGSSPLSSG
ncbi:hypothetical protein C8F01DRAFT_1369060 [Mycena amicta]|nr:hypothetical protein C8F01DRAFT_1369060 [Mycena amicta]